MEEKRGRRIASILCNLFVVLAAVGCLIHWALMPHAAADFWGREVSFFQYFTNLSNLFAAVTALVVLAYKLRGGALPRWAMLLKLMGTAAVGVTFCTVMLYLGPLIGYAPLFSDRGLFFHLLSPLVCIVSFAAFDGGGRVRFREALLGIAPTALYGLVYMVEVVAIGRENGGWVDIYGFNTGGLWYVSTAMMLVMTFLISLVLMALHNGLSARKTKA